jgi:hypothetical protein
MKAHTKITYTLMSVTAGAALLLSAGCSKQEPPAGETTKTMSPASTETRKAADTVAAAAQQAVNAATNQGGAAIADSMSQTQTLIDKAKGLVTDEKYKDALTVVRQLSGLRLTPEQRTLVDGLKAQIQTALAKSATSDAGSAAGNALGGSK